MKSVISAIQDIAVDLIPSRRAQAELKVCVIEFSFYPGSLGHEDLTRQKNFQNQ